MNYADILDKQRKFFRTHATKDLSFRSKQLKRLREAILQNEEELYTAIFEDFGKSRYDAFTTEISFVLKDIDYYLKNLKRLAKPKTVRTNLANQLASSKIYSEPLGNTLIIGAWNYPYQLTLSPIVASIAAGNTVMAKPSETAGNTAKAMVKLINETFPEDFLYCIDGGVEEITEVLKLRFDKIFFTGSPRVGKIIYEAAAKHLTPVTLELGGKSPAIVTDSANLDVAAKRIVWGKFLNAGQTCVATDYILADHRIKDKLAEKITEYLRKFDYASESQHYTQIINDQNFQRLIKMIEYEKVIFGGKHDAESRFIAPTVLDRVSWSDPVMHEEIFGPILPILSYEKLDETLDFLSTQEKPLAAYLFTGNKKDEQLFTQQFSFGGGCINDTVMHLSNDHLPFGGVGNSGIGSYHGIYGFDAFSHQKSILDRATWGEPNFKYPPYSEEKLKWIKRVM